MRKLILWMIILFPHFSKATNYYLSADGKDTYNGRSASKPWQTLSKVNTSAFLPTDSLLIRKGDVFYGALIAKCNIGAYSKGKHPVISGFATITSWTSIGKNLYQSPVLSVGASNTINMVLINGAQQALGRYPKKAYEAILSRTVNTITGSFNGEPSYEGGVIVIKTDNFLLEKRPIVSQSGATITYKGATTTLPIAGFGYFVQNCTAACTQQGDWYYDAVTRKITVYSSTKPTFNFQYSSIEVPVTLAIAGINIKNLRVTGGNKQNLEVKASYCSADNILSDYGDIGIRANAPYFTCVNSTITNTNAAGIFSNQDYTTILKCLVENVGLIPGAGGDGATANGVLMKGKNNRFIGNIIKNTGYNGIYAAGANLTVRDYSISNSCTVLTDGAAVYIDGAFAGTSGYVGNGISLNGSKTGIAGSTAPYIQVAGIYLDNNCSNVEVAYNTIFNMPLQGIFLHDGHLLKIHDNTIYNCAAGFAVQENNILKDISFYNNSITASGIQHVISFTYFTGGIHINTIGRFESNIYSRPDDESGIIYTYDHATKKSTYYSLSTFQTKYKLDLNSRKTPASYIPGSTIYPIYSTLESSVTQKANGVYQSLNGAYIANGTLMTAPMNSGFIMYKVDNGKTHNK